MESRRITIISTKNNKRTVINTNATTLSELKSALREANIDYNNMTFYEGLTKTELKLDESILPQNVQKINPVTGEPETTNELVFMLTNTNKKIKSGACSMKRSEAYATIKAQNLQAECLKRFGKNYTTCSTEDLVSIIAENQKFPKNTTVEKPSPIKKNNTEPQSQWTNTIISCVDTQVRETVCNLVHYLRDNDVIGSYAELSKILAPMAASNYESDSDSPYSEDELNDMFKDML